MNAVLRLFKATVEFLWWGGWWGLQSHFHVQPNYSVKVVLLVVLCCCWSCDNIGGTVDSDFVSALKNVVIGFFFKFCLCALKKGALCTASTHLIKLH